MLDLMGDQKVCLTKNRLYQIELTKVVENIFFTKQYSFGIFSSTFLQPMVRAKTSSKHLLD